MKESRTVHEKRWWERPFGIVVLGLIVTVVGGLILWLIIRPFDKLTPPPPTSTNPPSPAVPIVKTPKPAPQPPSVKIDQHGNGNGAVGGSVTQGPGSIAQIGGSNNNAQINNYAPPARRLSDDQRTALRDCLKITPGKFTVAALQNNGEAYRYAQDWSEVFSAAGWTNEEPIPVMIFMIGGGMWSGLRFRVTGDWDDVSKHATLVDGSPEKNAIECVKKAQVGGVAVPYKDLPTGSVRVDVSERPLGNAPAILESTKEIKIRLFEFAKSSHVMTFQLQGPAPKCPADAS